MTTSHQLKNLEKIAKLIRYWILKSTTEAGSGHPTSSLSAVELMVALMFGGFFRADLEHPENPNNDRLIFSKGHAAPLLYALYAAANKSQKSVKSIKSIKPKEGVITEEELMTLRKFGSRLEGHPSMAFPYTEAPTGSLGQGLSIGVGMALSAKLTPPNLPFVRGGQTDGVPSLRRRGIRGGLYRTFVLLGDSEMAEGSVWEAIQIAAHYKLDNLIGILDVNRLGQRGETMYGHRLSEYEKRIKVFGWNTIVVKDGNDMEEVIEAYAKVGAGRDLPLQKGKPTMIIARTLKGKGVSFLENKEGWHSKTLDREHLGKAIAELGEVDCSIRGSVVRPAKAQFPISNFQFPNKSKIQNSKQNYSLRTTHYSIGDLVPTKKAYGNALNRFFQEFQGKLVVLDAEVSNSTHAEDFQKQHPDRFFEMFIAEQNMIGVALGLSRRGLIPCVSTFAAFFTRAFDQIRMSQYVNANIKFFGSYAGVSLGKDGYSQMGLEDLAMFRTIQDSVVLYPSDAVSAESLIKESLKHQGIVYVRLTREATPIIYQSSETFKIGGSKMLRSSKNDVVTVVAAGITVREALAAYDVLLKQGINIRVIDLYSIKPVDEKTLRLCAKETKQFIVVEDHVAEGGVADAVRSAVSEIPVPVHSLAVRKIPKSGTPDELLKYEEIDRGAIARLVGLIRK